MKKSLFLMMIAAAAITVGYAQNTPPHAASTKTWVFGEQTWSDAIQVPECNGKKFPESKEPQCRSYAEGGKTWYYYNWYYVNRHVERLCPSLWRVPSRADFLTLGENSTKGMLEGQWGLGGFIMTFGHDHHDPSYVGGSNPLWTTSSYSEAAAFCASYAVSTTIVEAKEPISLTHNTFKDLGMQVRCVK
jgi:hypothetical protein